MIGIQLPNLTDYDPVKSAEGALDPLGLYAIADNLAIKLVPGIRERMSHPRFLTAIAVGAAINRDFEEDLLAADGQSEPYMVYEWHAVEGLYRKWGDNGLHGLPGILKTRDCVSQGLKLSAARYLKTASVFGFHGVYRLLANNLDIVRDGLLGDNGYELLSVWEKEQQLAGFLSGNNGNGCAVRSQIQGAIKDAIQKGHVDRSPTWQGWTFFGEHLFPNKIPDKERIQGTNPCRFGCRCHTGNHRADYKDGHDQGQNRALNPINQLYFGKFHFLLGVFSPYGNCKCDTQHKKSNNDTGENPSQEELPY